MRRSRPERLLFAASFVAALTLPAAAEDGEAPPATIPRLATTAPTAEAFAPQGWIVEAKASGDLDGDGRDDVAFVLHGTDPSLKLAAGADRAIAIDTNPRILGVALAKGGQLNLAAQNATLIPRHVWSNLDDAFEADGLSIGRGAVKVELRAFASAGGSDMATVSFVFRLKDGKLRAIGHDRSDVNRMSGEMTTTSVNYLTGRKSVTKGSISDDEKDLKPVWSKTPKQGPTIDEIDDGLMFGVPR